MNRKILLTNAVIVSPGLFIEKGSVLIDGGHISAVAPMDSKPTAVENSGTEVIDLGGRILMPGFVNPHTHLYSSLSAGLSALAPADDFTAVLKNFWWPLDAVHNEESVYYSAVAGIIDAVKHGVTCIFDHHASMNYVGGSLETVARAFSLAGIKGVCCLEVSDRPGCATAEQQINENIDFIERHSGGMLKGMLGLHANFTLSGKTMKLAAEMSGDAGISCPVHIHCGEDRADFDYCRNEGFAGPVDRLESFGLLGPDSILAHCIHLSNKDRELISEIRPWIVSNPESNANNRVGRADRSVFPEYLIGTDGMSFDMVASLRSQFLLGDGLSEDFGLLEKAFIRSPADLLQSWFPSSGRIEKGFDADIAVLDYIPQTPINSENTIGHLIYGARGGRVFMTVSGGRILYRDGNITFTYETALLNQIKEAASALHRRYYG